MKNLFIAILFYLLLSCQSSTSPVVQTDNTFSIKEGILSDLIKFLPGTSYKMTGQGVEIYSAVGTSYHSLDSKSYWAEGAAAKCLIVQKEGYNYYYAFDSKVLVLLQG